MPALDIPRKSVDTLRSTSDIKDSSQNALLNSEELELADKDAADQIELLNTWLQKATRIKEGASNLLGASQPRGTQRGRIEAELQAAENRIRVLKERLESIKDLTLSPPQFPPKHILRPQPSIVSSIGGDKERDKAEDDTIDYRTASQLYSGLVRTLASLPDRLSPEHPFPYNPPLHSPPIDRQPLDLTQPMWPTLDLPSILSSNDDLDLLRLTYLQRLTTVLRGNTRVRYEVDTNYLMPGILPALSSSTTPEIRAAAYRLIRTLLNPHGQRIMRNWDLEWFIVRSLCRDSNHKYGSEREQALLFVRAVVSVSVTSSSTVSPRDYKGEEPEDKLLLGEATVRTLVSIAEAESDVLRGIAVMTLGEILLVAPCLADSSGALTCLLHIISSPPISPSASRSADDIPNKIDVSSLAPALLSIVLTVVDRPRGRGLFRIGYGLEMVLTGITNCPYPTPSLSMSTNGHLQAMSHSATLITSLLRSWSGMLYLCSNDMTAVKSIVTTLRIPSLPDAAREIILDMFFGLFKIVKPDWHKAFISGRRLTMYRKSSKTPRSPDALSITSGMTHGPPPTISIPMTGTTSTSISTTSNTTNTTSTGTASNTTSSVNGSMTAEVSIMSSVLEADGEHHPQSPFLDGQREESNTNGVAGDRHTTQKRKLKLTDQYLALLLVILCKAGLFDALIYLLEETPTSSPLGRKATLLVGEVLEIANRVLPMSYAANIQALPRLFTLAASYTDPALRTVGTSTLSLIDSFNRNRSRLTPIRAIAAASQASTFMARQRSNSSSLNLLTLEAAAVATAADSATMARRREMDAAKLKSNLSIDDRAYQLQLVDTGVMASNEHMKWNYDGLLALIKGPLLNSKRFEEAFRVSKFGRKLMKWFHPLTGKFPKVRNTKSNHRWVKLGCALLSSLVSHQEGQRYLLNDDALLKQIVSCFAQLDPFNTTPTADHVFSQTRIQDTLSWGYFEMLGTLSKTPEGIELLEKFHIFTALYHVSELKSREDLIMLIIQHLDYTPDGHARIVLSKALTSSYNGFRRYATQHLGQLVQNTSGGNANFWTLRLLVTQLYDPSIEVCELAVHYLNEACEDPSILELVVEMRPTLDHLDEIAHPLLLKFMSTPVGFRYLHGADYIDREMNMWFHERNYHYVVQVEVYLSKSFGALTTDDDDEVPEFDGTVPPHFYGEMAKTELGCHVLQEKGHVAEFAHFIRQHGLESEDSELILKLKSVLWAVGNVGANDGGLPFLEDEQIIGTIIEIAQQSLVLSVRGTCFFVLGLISSTSQGAEILDDYGWEATVSPAGLTTGLCVPLEVENFVDIPPWEPYSPPKPKLLKDADSHMELELETAIYNLGNPVIQNSTSRGLQKLKQRRDARVLFNSLSMYFRALHAIATHSFKLSTRKFILDLFDFELDAALVQELNVIAKTLVLEEDELDAQVQEAAAAVAADEVEASLASPRRNRRMTLRGGTRISMMPKASDDDDSDVEVDVVGGVVGNARLEDDVQKRIIEEEEDEMKL